MWSSEPPSHWEAAHCHGVPPSVSREVGYHESIPKSRGSNGLSIWTREAECYHPGLSVSFMTPFLNDHNTLSL